MNRRLLPLHPRVWIVLGALWVVTHSWGGLRHDGVLYAAQAMLHLRPEVFSGDLFFAYGSQDDFTIFGRLYAAVIDRVGLGRAALLLWALSQASWFAVALAWVRHLVSPSQVLGVAALSFSLPSIYSGDLVFRFAESFLTARSVAEPLALAGVLAAFTARRRAAAVSLLASAAFHPIMALPGIVVVILLAITGRFGAGVLGFLAIVPSLVVLALGGLQVLPTMDPQWLAAVGARSSFVVPGQWTASDWCQFLYPLAVLGLVGRFVGGAPGRLWEAVAATGLMGLLLSLSSWLVDWPLGLQAQTWRFVWLGVWAAPVAALVAACAIGRDRPVLRSALLATVPALALLGQSFWSLSWLLPTLHAGSLWLLLRRRVKVSRLLVHVVTVHAVVIALVALAGGLMVAFTLWWQPDGVGDVSDLFLPSVVISFVGWALVLAYLSVCSRNGDLFGTSRPGVLAISIAVAAAMLVADSRTPRAARVEALARTGIPAWEAIIAQDATVLWPNWMEAVWFGLQRRSYVSRVQMSGVVFSMDTAMEGVRRLAMVSGVAGRDAVLAQVTPRESAEEPKPTRVELSRACGDPMLGFVVLRESLGPLAAPLFHEPVSGGSFYLHRCADYLPRRP